jgi:hypothetical protein
LRRTWSSVSLLVAVAASGAGSIPLAAKDDAEQSLLDFVTGDYAIIGQEPDGGAAYVGSASIEPEQGGVTLKERHGSYEFTAHGTVEAPSPGEGKVLRFRWQDDGPMIMSCLVAGDLDNYARLTCYWLRQGSEPKQPGLEAMFPTAAWPKP